MIDERFQAPSRESVLPLDGLIGIRRGANGDATLAPSSEFAPKDVGEVLFYVDLAVESFAHVAIVISRMVSAGVAITAFVGTRKVRIETPIEGHPLYAV
jgi:hypothetical protein